MDHSERNIGILTRLLGDKKEELHAATSLLDLASTVKTQKEKLEELLAQNEFDRAASIARNAESSHRFDSMHQVLAACINRGPFSVAKKISDEIGMKICATDTVNMIIRLKRTSYGEAILAIKELSDPYRRIEQTHLINELCEKLAICGAEVKGAREGGLTNKLEELLAREQLLEHYIKCAATLSIETKTPPGGPHGNQQNKKQKGRQGQRPRA